MDGGVVFERLEVRHDLDFLVEGLRNMPLQHGGPAVGISQGHGKRKEQVNLDQVR